MKLKYSLSLAALAAVSISQAIDYAIPLDEERRLETDTSRYLNTNSRVQFGIGAPALYNESADHWFAQRLYMVPFATIPFSNNGIGVTFLVTGPNLDLLPPVDTIPFDRIEVALFDGDTLSPDGTPVSLNTGSGTSGVWSFAKTSTAVSVSTVNTDITGRYELPGAPGVWASSTGWMPTTGLVRHQVYRVRVGNLTATSDLSYVVSTTSANPHRYWLGVRFISNQTSPDSESIRMIPIECMDTTGDVAAEIINGDAAPLQLSNEASTPSFRPMSFWLEMDDNYATLNNLPVSQSFEVALDFSSPMGSLRDYSEVVEIWFDESTGTARSEWVVKADVISEEVTCVVNTFVTSSLSGDIRVKPRNGLSIRIPDVTFGSPLSPPSYPGTIIMGDCDNDNEVSAADVDIVINSFGSTWVSKFPVTLLNPYGLAGDQPVGYDIGYDINADLDRSGEVDGADYDIVIAAFGLAGDP